MSRGVAFAGALSNYFSAFVSVADCPGLLPEFAFAAQADMMAPSLFADALGKLPDPDRSVMSHFVKFGRAFGASESYVRCRDAQPNHAVQFDAPLTWCNPTHLILTPEEVKRLQAEVAAVLSVADENLRYYFQDFGRYVSAAAKEDRAILFQGFD